MIPPITSWTLTQAIGFSILFGMIGAAVIIGIAYGLASGAFRTPKKSEPFPGAGKGRPSLLPATPDQVVPITRSAEANGRVLVTDVVGCARCGGDHPRRLLLKFTRPPKDATHYTVCPITEEPLLVEVRDVADRPAKVDARNYLDREPPRANA